MFIPHETMVVYFAAEKFDKVNKVNEKTGKITPCMGELT